jgi:hypothetical protein
MQVEVVRNLQRQPKKRPWSFQSTGVPIIVRRKAAVYFIGNFKALATPFP